MLSKATHYDIKLHFILHEQLLVNQISHLVGYLIDWLMKLVIIYQGQQVTDSPSGLACVAAALKLAPLGPNFVTQGKSREQVHLQSVCPSCFLTVQQDTNCRDIN